MAHLSGWISHVVGGGVVGYLGGILTKVYGPVAKYSFDKANELKEVIVKIRREIDALEAPPREITIQSSTGVPGVSLSDWQVRIIRFPEYVLDLKSGLELIRWYPLIRHLVPLPSKKNIEEAAKLLPQLFEVKREDYQKALTTAKKIKKLLA